MEDEKFVQICGKSLFWHADSSKSSDYLPLSYQSHFQFHLDHILSSYPILTTKLQYLICSSETRENILSESDHNYNTARFIKLPGLISNTSWPILCLNLIWACTISCNHFEIICSNRYLCTEGDISTVPFYTGSSYFPNSGIFFQKSNFWVFSQSIKRAIYNRTNS